MKVASNNPSVSEFLAPADTKRMENVITAKRVEVFPNQSIEPCELTSKPRTDLFQGRENDEPKVHQVNSDMDARIIFDDSNIRAGNILKYPHIQFGTLCSDEIHCKKQEGLCSIGCQLTKGIFMGSNFLTKAEKMKTGKYVNNCSLHVEIIGADPTKLWALYLCLL